MAAEGRALNALEFKKKFAKYQEEGALDKAWDATSDKKGTRVKLGGGFYCGQIEVDGVKYYTFVTRAHVPAALPFALRACAHPEGAPDRARAPQNAFFMTMRGKFTTPGTSIHYYVVEFDPASLSWEDFRGSVLGPTDPKDA